MSRGFELAVGFIVILIISIVIFGMGLFLVFQFLDVTTKIEQDISSQTRIEIEQRLLQTGDQVAIPFNKKEVSIGENTVFGIGILNIKEQETTFKAEACFHRALDAAQKEVQADRAFVNQEWIFTDLGTVTLARNKRNVLPIPVFVSGKMSNSLATQKEATYVFNVCVYESENAPEPCSAASVCMVDSPSALDLDRVYGRKILKVYVDVIA